MASIFISYRRKESRPHARSIYEALNRRFPDQVFMDTGHLGPGEKFADRINQQLNDCRVMLALIGPQWAQIRDEQGARRLDDPRDWIRQETTTALRRNIKVIPVLIEGAAMPKAAELPEDMRALLDYQAYVLDLDQGFDQGMEILARSIRTELPPVPASPLRRYVPVAAVVVSLGLAGYWLNTRHDKPAETIATAPAAPASAASPQPKPGDVIKDCADCPELVLLPTGSFMMGSPEGEKDREGDEGPVHRVTISQQIAVGRHEVSRGEFGRFVAESQYQTEAEKSGGCSIWTGEKWEAKADRNWRSPGFEQGEDHPVVCVSWNDAQAYVKWLNGKVAGKGFRLLSEAEWEYAARAGKGGSRFPWGDDGDYSQMCRYANGPDRTAKEKVPGAGNWTIANCSDGYAYTAPGNALMPNEFGLYHMHGNAWEWVQDVWHDKYEGAPGDGSAWESGGDASRRVLRGGSWGGNPRGLRSAYRDRSTPGNRNGYVGFRIARTF